MRQASPSITSVSPPPASKKASGKKFVPPKAAKTKPSERGSSPVASSSRPGPKPLTGMSAGKAGESGKASSRGGPGDSDSWMLTNAERRKLDEKTSKREAQDTYHFLRPDQIRDSFMKRPDDPEYDERTIHIPKKAFESMTPFEKQFWEIKKDHFDTVLFFQKGKFYELYENDAAIGHQEFDLKLTDRVKMSMVRVAPRPYTTHSLIVFRSVYRSKASSSGRPSSLRRGTRSAKLNKRRLPLEPKCDRRMRVLLERKREVMMAEPRRRLSGENYNRSSQTVPLSTGSISQATTRTTALPSR